MEKIKEAIEILKAFGLPKSLQNERSGRTLCALADIREETPWVSAQRRLIRIHDIMQFISEHYKFTYAENSRETIRRQTIHQLVQAEIVDRNPDDPTRPTNSGKTVYTISKYALPVIKNFGTRNFTTELKRFISKHGTLKSKYDKRRNTHAIPVKIENKIFSLSTGKHNELQKDIIENFVPRFAKNATLLYLGDTAEKHLYFDNEKLESLSIPVTKHSKLPDIVLYDESKNLLFLIEAVTSHGPVSPKRHFEIEEMLESCTARKAYVSAFLDFKTYLRYAKQIAWETEVWLSDNPDHMIHYNGDKFLASIDLREEK